MLARLSSDGGNHAVTELVRGEVRCDILSRFWIGRYDAVPASGCTWRPATFWPASGGSVISSHVARPVAAFAVNNTRVHVRSWRQPLFVTVHYSRACSPCCTKPDRCSSTSANPALDIAPWANRVRSVEATHDGVWEPPVLGEVTVSPAVLIRPDGHVARAGDLTEPELPQALATSFRAAKSHSLDPDIRAPPRHHQSAVGGQGQRRLTQH